MVSESSHESALELPHIEQTYKKAELPGRRTVAETRLTGDSARPVFAVSAAETTYVQSTYS